MTIFNTPFVDQRGIGSGPLELPQHVAADVNGFGQAFNVKGVLFDAGNPEVVIDCARADDQIIESEGVATRELERLAVPIDAGDGRLPKGKVVLLLKNRADAVRDLFGLQTRRRHLVDKRLKGVVVVLIDQNYIDRGFT